MLPNDEKKDASRSATCLKTCFISFIIIPFHYYQMELEHVIAIQVQQQRHLASAQFIGKIEKDILHE